MAQTGFTPIALYYSTTAGVAPTAGNLVAGELAINTADGKLFYKDSSGVVQVLATKSGAAGVFTSVTDSGLTAGRVTFAEENRVRISRIGLDLLQKIAPKIGGDVYAIFDAEHSVQMKRTQGSTHPAEVRKQIRLWKNKLNPRKV